MAIFTVYNAAFTVIHHLATSTPVGSICPALDGAAPEGMETVTVYEQYPEQRKKSRPFHYAGAEMMISVRLCRLGPKMENWQQAKQFSFSDFVYTRQYTITIFRLDGTVENSPEHEYRLAVAMLASPWNLPCPPC